MSFSQVIVCQRIRGPWVFDAEEHSERMKSVAKTLRDYATELDVESIRLRERANRLVPQDFLYLYMCCHIVLYQFLSIYQLIYSMNTQTFAFSAISQLMVEHANFSAISQLMAYSFGDKPVDG